MAKFILFDLANTGVNVDKSPLELARTDVTRAANAVRDLARKGIRNRPGLATLNDTAAAGSVLGGIGVPFLNESSSGLHLSFIGRGPTS